MSYKEKLFKLKKQLDGNFFEKTLLTSAVSLPAGIAFALYNGILGIMYGAV